MKHPGLRHLRLSAKMAIKEFSLSALIGLPPKKPPKKKIGVNAQMLLIQPTIRDLEAEQKKKDLLYGTGEEDEEGDTGGKKSKKAAKNSKKKKKTKKGKRCAIV